MLKKGCCRAIVLIAVVLAAVAGGCGKGADAGAVVLYTSVDEPYARPLIERFTRETGIAVTLLTDTEASKSVGLAEKLRAEKAHPRADVWWSNECFLTIRLANDGVLAVYDSPSARDIPQRFKDSSHLWAGSALRVRMMVSSVGAAGAPLGYSKLRDLLRPELKGRIALARPTAGTTGGQVAALYTIWGDRKADEFFRSLHENGVHLLGGNGPVAEAVARGEVLLGVCDNDDAADARENIGKLNAELPDQGGEGTLAMPCTVGLVAGAPHAEAARRLIDFLLSAETDRDLIAAKFAWCSVREMGGKGKFMEVNYSKVAEEMPGAIRRGTGIMEGR